MEVALMKAERRSAIGRNQTQKLRQEGWMPAVIYGEGQDAMSIQISEWELEQHLKARHKVYKLDVAGTTVSVFLQEVAFKAINDRPLHADFLRIDLEKPLDTVVEIALLGHAQGLSRGGVLVKDNLKISIKALPRDLPEGLEVNITPLKTGDVLHAKDLPLPEGVALNIDPETPICRVTQPSAAKMAKLDGGDDAAEGGAEGDSGSEG